MREHVRLRFPRLSVMDSFQIFSVSFNRADHAIDFVDEKLTILSDYLGIDVSLLRSDYEDLRVAVTHAQHNKKLEGEIAIYDYVLTHFRHEQKDMKLLDAVQVWFVIQAQNGQLERDFSTKRRLEDRLKGHFTPQVLDQRLRIRANGPDPDHLWQVTKDGIRYEDAVVQVAHATLAKHGSTPQKRQLGMQEVLAEGMPAQRKQRKDTGGTHKTATEKPDHTREPLVSRNVDGEPEADVVLIDAEPVVLDGI